MIVAVVIPVYNEQELLPRLIARLDATERPRLPDDTLATRHVVIVDDGSSDDTPQWIAEHLQNREDFTCICCATNRGKGAAIKTGFLAALDRGADIVLVQDADLEYDPRDHQAALDPILDGRADAVIGSRFIGQTHRVLYYWHSVANKAITMLSNMLSNLNLTDIECGTKAFSARTLRAIAPELRENRFGIEPELVARLARLRLSRLEPGSDTGPGTARDSQSSRPGAMVLPARVYEVPVSYAGRTYAEGKKIGWRDGLAALRCIVRYNLL